MRDKLDQDDCMTLHTAGLAQARNTFFDLAARAHAGEPSLLTRHGQPYAAIVPPDLLVNVRPRARFMALRGSGKGLWGRSPADRVAGLRAEWSRADGLPS